MPGVTSELLAEAVRLHNPRAQVQVQADRTEVVAGLVGRARPGDLMLVVGAGDVTTLAPELLNALEGQ